MGPFIYHNPQLDTYWQNTETDYYKMIEYQDLMCEHPTGRIGEQTFGTDDICFIKIT